jgi:hypothetical protein
MVQNHPLVCLKRLLLWIHGADRRRHEGLSAPRSHLSCPSSRRCSSPRAYRLAGDQLAAITAILQPISRGLGDPNDRFESNSERLPRAPMSPPAGCPRSASRQRRATTFMALRHAGQPICITSLYWGCFRPGAFFEARLCPFGRGGYDAGVGEGRLAVAPTFAQARAEARFARAFLLLSRTEGSSWYLSPFGDFYRAACDVNRNAVYASQPLSPVATQHSLPSGRYSLLGPDMHRLDRTSFAWRTHSMTSSARASSVGGISRPSALAVFRLIKSSYFEACSIGRSAGFAPLSILSM